MSDSNPYQPPSSEPEPLVKQPQNDPNVIADSIGGWLILIAIGLVLAPIFSVTSLAQEFFAIFQSGLWESLTSPESDQYHAYWAPLLIFEFIGNLGFTIAIVYAASLFFRKKKLFPITYICILWFNLCFIVLTIWLASLFLPEEAIWDTEMTRQISRSLISALIWIPYMLVSKRVKRTFLY